MNKNQLIDGLLDTIFENYTEEELQLADILSDIACIITSKRAEMHLNQKEFAKKLGVNQSMVSKWESGSYNFTIESLYKIARALKLTFINPLQDKQQYSTIKSENDEPHIFYLKAYDANYSKATTYKLEGIEVAYGA